MRSFRRFWIAAALLAAIPALGQAQTRRVSGLVTVAGSSEPVAGATIQVVGTTLGTVADESGRFSVSVPPGDHQLRVRRIGFQAKLVAVAANATAVNVGLTRDVLQLETQVITGQATSVSQANAANAVTVVTSQALNRVPQQTIENALQGKVPGAVITQNSGAPGGGIQVQIRGTNTINGSYQPLYVVDGVIVNNDAYSNGLEAITSAGSGGSGQVGAGITSSQDQQVNRIADLNPEDIASIEVLKGPSAGAIYGSRGANGVVIITTKKGTTGKPVMNFIQRFGTQSLEHSIAMRCFTQSQAATLVDQTFGAGASAGYFAKYPYAGCTDAQQTLYGNHGLDYETDASLRGGFNSTTYFASGLVKHDAGLAPDDQYNKQSLRLNLTQALGPKLSLRANTEILHTLTQRGISGNDNTTINPITVISATPTFFNFAQLDPKTGQYIKDPWVGSGSNILQNATQVKTPENVYRMIGSAAADWTMFSSTRQSLTFDLLGGVDSYADNAQVYSPPTTYIEQSGAISPYPGSIVKDNTNVTNANLNLSAVHKLMTSGFTATTSAGLRQARAQSDYVSNLGQGLFPGLQNFSQATQISSAEGQYLNKAFSYYAQEEFLTLDERLLLTAAVNSERSSTNGNPRKFYSYPKFSASYRVPWLPRFTDNFKLRLAYGKAGNLVPVDYKYTYLQTVPEGGVNGLRASTQVGLSTVHPEITSELEGGFDATFAGGRIGLEYTRYQKRTTDLVLTANLAPSTGFTSKVVNGGSLINIGTEVALNLIPIQSRNFTWTSNTTFSRNKGEITALPVPAFNTGSGFGERFGGSKIQVGYSPTQVVTYSGFDSTFKNGVYVSRAPHEIHPGDAQPDFIMGFTNDFDIGRFRVATLLDWRKGGYIVNLTNDYFDYGIIGGNLADTAARNARLAGYRKELPVYLEHSSFAKLRELTISYDLGASMAHALFGGRASDVRIELSGHNLKTWTPYTGYDPEVSNFGNAAIGRIQDVTPYPPSRQFFFSLNATF